MAEENSKWQTIAAVIDENTISEMAK